MHPEAFVELNKPLLNKITLLFSAGSKIENILDVLSSEDPNDGIYSFYLEAACGVKLEGSIFLKKWNTQSSIDRKEILEYMEAHAKKIRENEPE